MTMQLFRPESRLTPDEVKTYAISAPLATHTRVATCEEVNCPPFLSGWVTNIDTGTELGRRQSYYLRRLSGRHFTLSKAGALETYEFPAGESCFTEHRVPLERPALYLKYGGDWRQQIGPRANMRAADWVDDFAEHQDNIATTIERG